MMFFDDDTRKVNPGRMRQRNKDDTLRNAQKERDARNLARKRQNAALCIQSAYRSFRSRDAARSASRERTKHIQVDISKIDLRNLTTLLRHFSLFENFSGTDMLGLYQLCHILSASCEKGAEENIWSVLISEPSTRTSMRNMLVLCCNQLEQNSSNVAVDNLVGGFTTKFTSLELSLASANRGSSKASLDVVRQYVTEWCSAVLGCGIVQALSRSLLAQNVETPALELFVERALHICLRCLELPLPTAVQFRKDLFWALFQTSPQKILRKSTSGVAILAPSIFEELLVAISTETDVIGRVPDQVVVSCFENVLGELADLVLEKSPSLSHSLMDASGKALLHLSQALPTATQTVNLLSDSDDELMEDVTSKSVHTQRLSDVAAVVDFDIPIPTSLLELIFTMSDKSTKERCLNKLAFSPNCIPQLWKSQADINLAAEIMAGSTNAVKFAHFCEILSRRMMITVADEIVNQSSPLPLETFKTIAAIIKDVLTKYYKQTTIPSPKLVAVTRSMRALAVSLLDHSSIFPARWWAVHQLSDHEIFRKVVSEAPYLVSFETRVRYFRSIIRDEEQTMWAASSGNVRRDHVLEDGFSLFDKADAETFRGPMKVSFINELGLPEAGIDGGGLFKDFLTKTIEEALDPRKGLFLATEAGLYYPNPASAVMQENHLRYFHYVGRMLGKALFDGILVNCPLAPFFFRKVLGKPNYVEDLPSLDDQLFRNLMFLKNMDGGEEDLQLTFCLSNEGVGEVSNVELRPDGANIPVTGANKNVYISLVANYKLNIQIRAQSRAFLGGLRDVVPVEALRLFNQDEIDLLVNGSRQAIDLQDLRQNCLLHGFEADEDVIELFWEVLASFSDSEKEAFLKFVTSSPRPPLLGFSELQPKFQISKVPDDTRLPSASTCFNQFKLPTYSDRQTMRERLLFAINGASGFELS